MDFNAVLVFKLRVNVFIVIEILVVDWLGFINNKTPVFLI